MMHRPLLPEGNQEDDVGFCNRITVEAGVTALPVRPVSIPAVPAQPSTSVQPASAGSQVYCLDNAAVYSISFLLLGAVPL